MKPSCGRSVKPIHSIPFIVAYSSLQRDVNNYYFIIKGACIKFDSAELSYDNKNRIQALELLYNDRRMAIKVTPPDTVCKTGAVSKHGSLPTLEMDFRKDDKLIQNSSSKSFRGYVEKSKKLSRWIYNKK